MNGHDRASSPSAALHAPAEKGSAASVDASGASAASAAVSAAAALPRQASTDREACAEAAHAPSGRERYRQARLGGRAEAEPQPRVTDDANARLAAREDTVSSGAQEKLPPGPGEDPLPDDIADFVDEIHSRVDLFEVLHDLLISKDEKIKQRAIEKILEMKYGKGAASSEEPVQVVLDVPRPIRD